MTSNESIYDMRTAKYHQEDQEVPRSKDLCFQINQTLPSHTQIIRQYFGKLFHHQLPSTSTIMTPTYIDRANKVTIGRHTFINHHLVTVALGGITIGDNVQIAPNVTLLTANHDQNDLQLLHCYPINIENNAWVGAGAKIMPGVTVGQGAIVASGAVVTKDVPDRTVVAGVPAKVIKQLG